MPSVKSVIGIEVEDGAFKRFQDLFARYSDQVDAMPEAWQKLNAVIGDSAKGLEAGALNAKDAFAAIAAQAGIVGAALRDAIKAQSKLGQATSHSGKAMSGLQKAATGVGGALKTIGGWIVRIGAFAGLGGLLGGIGFGDLANATFNRSRASGRFGLTPGQLASFDVNAQQFIGRGALEGAVGAQGDVTKGGALAGLGIDPRAAQSMSPVDLAFVLQRKALAIYQREKKSGAYLNDPRLQAYVSQLGGDYGDLRNLDQNGGPRASFQAQADYHRDIAALEIPRAQRDEWNKLKITLDRAGATIQTVFIKQLSLLAPDIANLTTKFVSLFSSIANTKTVDNAIHALHFGLNEFNKFLEPKNLTAAHKEFDSMIATVRTFGAELKVLVDKFRWLLGTGDIDDKKKASMNAESQKGWKNFGAAITGAGVSDWWTKSMDRIVGTKDAIAKKIASIAQKAGVNPLMAIATAMHESGLNPRAVGDNNSSFGAFQLHRGGELGNLTKEQAFDVGTNATTAMKEFSALNKLSKQAVLQRFSRAVRYAATHFYKGKQIGPTVSHNDIMALFNSPGMYAAAAQRPSDPYDYALDVNRIVEKLGTHVSRQAPKPAARAAHHAQKTAQITIVNQTAARVVISTNAVAVG